MKLSIWSSYYVELSPEDAITELAMHGIKYCELSDEHGEMLLGRGDPAVIGKEFGEFAKKAGVTVTQGHLWLKIQLCTDPEAVPVLKKWIDLFRAIGIKNAVLHCDSMKASSLEYREKLDKNAEVLKEIRDYVKGTDFRICLENLMGIVRSADDLNYIIDKLDSDNFGICLDTGHLNLTAKNQAEFIKTAGKRLHALHIADNEGERDQHMMPFGKGNVNFGEVFSALAEIGYDGLYNLEIPGERKAPLEILGYKAEYIAKTFAFLEEKNNY